MWAASATTPRPSTATSTKEHTITAESPSDRYAATNTIAGKITALRDEMRATVPAVDDPQAKALLETGAEVLNGLQHAFIDYADGSEEAWQR